MAKPQGNFHPHIHNSEPTALINLQKMGRNSRSAKLYGKVVAKDTSEWSSPKGPANQKAKDKSKPNPTVIDNEALPVISSLIPVELQQLLLNIFKDAFPAILASDSLQPLLQEIKRHLYDRNFDEAFGKSEYLEAYSIRWSPVSFKDIVT
jgi:25S rRNA (uracil2843-N3)-methyltransferase